MSLKPKSAALWLAVPLMAMNLIACGDDEEVPRTPPDIGDLCGNGDVDEDEECDDGNLNPQDGCLPNCTEAQCGDGVVQLTPASAAEECDDGNRVNGDSCSNMCKGPECGNGTKESGEACDDGNEVNDDGCTNDCAPASCGNKIVEGDEECDDGNNNDTDACTDRCLESACGDGIVQGTEECDLGSANSNAGVCLKSCKNATCGDTFVLLGVEACDSTDEDECTETCALPSCGDGEVQEGEVCDDGNQSNTDACSNLCLPTLCGDGVRQSGEDCDDGNGNNNDDCLNTCKNPACGDGILHNLGSGDEVCDEGEDNGPFPANCSDECTLTACGNGELDPGEDCDEGDANNDYASCKTDCTFNVCGDGKAYLVETPGTNNTGDLEECDDMNADDADACIADCTWNKCGDGHRYTKAYNREYDDNEDGNEAFNNPFPLEPCDDGNTSNNDGCTTTETEFDDVATEYEIDEDGEPDPTLEDNVDGLECRLNVCGDGQVYSNKVAGDGNPNPAEDCDDRNSINTDSCIDTCKWASCQDGWLYTTVNDPQNPNDEEECDDGNASNIDGCVGACAIADCGDGFVQHGVEDCDDAGAAGGCGTTCESDLCGNGDLDPGEECDDNNTNDSDSCLNTCHWNTCGDGARYMAVTDPDNDNAIEQCDDGNGLNRDHCLSSCVWNSCGDGAHYSEYPNEAEECEDEGREGITCDVDTEIGCINAGANPMDECINPFVRDGFDPSPAEGPFVAPELCDDGNGEDGDSCTGECVWNVCGDGIPLLTVTDARDKTDLAGDPITTFVEECDDGEESASCTGNLDDFSEEDEPEAFACKTVACGDGIVSVLAGETCDPEDDGEGGTAELCDNTCVSEDCGNNVVEGYEDCDDGNQNNNDGCTNNCLYPRCGDGIVQATEECDDGNSDPTDACTNACLNARCGDGIRRAGVEVCDIGEEDAPAGGQVSNTDGYLDSPGYCNQSCRLRCFDQPNVAWADDYDGNCLFVPEDPEAADDAVTYDDLNDGEDVTFKGFVGAEAYCESLGINAHLVKVDSVAKNAVVTDIINAASAADEYDNYESDQALVFGQDGPIGVNAYWIGLYDDHTTQPDPEGYWTWVSDGSLVSNAVQGQWAADQPDDMDVDPNTAGQEDCGVAFGMEFDETNEETGVGDLLQDAEWADEDCTRQLRFVCEFPLAQNP
jgi:cysteine-rich repeat protein